MQAIALEVPLRLRHRMLIEDARAATRRSEGFDDDIVEGVNLVFNTKPAAVAMELVAQMLRLERVCCSVTVVGHPARMGLKHKVKPAGVLKMSHGGSSTAAGVLFTSIGAAAARDGCGVQFAAVGKEQ